MTTTSSESTSALPQVAQPQDKRDLPSKMGKQSIWSSIQLKATLAAVAIGTLPVIAIGATAYYFANQSLTAQINQTKQTQAVQLSDKLNRFMVDRYGDIQIMASLSIFRDAKLAATTPLPDKQAALNRFLDAYLIYDSIAIFDLEGNVIVQSLGEPLPNHKDRVYFQQALNSSNPVVSNPELSKSTGKQVIHFAAPVKDKATGKTIAVIRARMPINRLEEIILGFSTRDEELHVIDSSGRFFIANEQAQVGRSAPVDFPGLDLFLTNKKVGNLVTVDKIDGAEQLVAYAPVVKLPGAPELGWGSIVAVDTNIAFAPQRQLLQTLLVGTGIATLLVAAIAVYLARRATRPLLDASAAVEKVGRGELDTRVVVKGEDELALLGTNINQMAGRIKGLLEEAQESSNQIERQNALLEESNALQDDVETILDVVLAVEEGDMTVQAPVSDRMTGLVSDTLNRLIEQLGATLSQVLSTAQQVTEGAKNLENLNAIVAGNSGEQSQSIADVLQLTENVEKIARDSSANVVKSNQSLLSARSAVAQGQDSMSSLTIGFEVLQQGMGKISNRTEALQAFIDLADQFAQEQSQVASMTQMLSLSADQLGAKALAQDDPKEFRMSALEFKAIANQISELSKQAFTGLSSLKQRSEGVHTLVSGVNKEVRDLASLVASFDEIVTQSIQAFNNVQDTTEQVVQVGNTVEQSSQKIVATSQSTAEAMRNIAQLAERTAQLTQTTQTQSEQMGSLSNQLLKSIQFFRLPASGKNVLDIETAEVSDKKLQGTESSSQLESFASLI